MYEGKDRVKQVNVLRELTDDIVSYSGLLSPADARPAVAIWLNAMDLPDWYDDHDEELLLKWVTTEILKDILYQDPTGYVEFVDLSPESATNQLIGIEIVVLSPERTVAYRLTTPDLDLDWELGNVEEAASYILEKQAELADIKEDIASMQA